MSSTQLASKAKSAAVSTIISKWPLVKKKQVSGRIVVLQEERFRLKRDDGQVLLLRLSHSANVDALQLCDFHDRNQPVDVEYVGDANLNNAVALRVGTR